MTSRRPRLRFMVLAAVGLVLVAVFLLYITAPKPTILRVRITDAATGKPLVGALVQIQSRGQQPLPVVTTGEDGIAAFRNPPPSATYVVTVQKLDYELVIRPQVAVPEAATTALDVPLTARPGGRLYVGLDTTRVSEIDTASLLPVGTARLPNWKQGAVSRLLLNPAEELLYTVTTAEGRTPTRAAGVYDEIDVLLAPTKAIKRRLEVQTAVQDLELTPDSRYLLALAAPAGSQAQLFDQSELITLDAAEGWLLTRTQLADLDLSAYGNRSPSWASQAPAGTVPPADGLFYSSPRAQLVLKRDGAGMYVLQGNEAQVWLLDMAARRVLDRELLQARPQGGALSTDGQTLYIWATDPGFTQGFPVPSVSIAVPGKVCPSTYMTTTAPLTFTAVSSTSAVMTATQAVTYQLMGPDIGAIIYDGGQTLRSCTYFQPSQPINWPIDSDVLAAIRTDSNRIAWRQPLPSGTTGLAVSPNRPELYILNGVLGTLSIYSLDSSLPPAVVAVGNEPTAVAISADGHWAYVANRQSHSISAIYLPDAAVIQTIPLDGSPFSLALQ